MAEQSTKLKQVTDLNLTTNKGTEELDYAEHSPLLLAASPQNLDNAENGQLNFPKAIYFIVGNEFCERFSFYGMKTILLMYLQQYLQMSESIATAIVHSFIMFAYFFPLVGGILSDSYLGKFRTIVYLSLIYSLGNVVLSVTAIPGVTGTPGIPGSPPHWWGAALGLFMLAVGTGGIKPCVSAFGGDQFHPSQTREIQIFFSLFYFSINFGSMLSTFITPELRSISCLGLDSCFSLAFGIPAILMIVATVIFVAGSNLYQIVPPQGNVLVKIVNVMREAFAQRLPTNGTAHWLDGAIPKFGSEMVRDIKELLSVLFMFLPLPIFWALFDQQSSRWVSQAQIMDLHVPFFKDWKLKPEQMQLINAFLILVMIPLFETIIYPLISRIGINFRPLQRMATGMGITGLAFIAAALLQLSVMKGTFERNSQNELFCTANCTSVFWQFPQYVLITAAEILFSITGLEFAYSQAPASMKSVCQASWLLTVAVGNLVVVIVAGGELFHELYVEFFFFAGLVFLATVVFMIMSLQYKYKKAFEDEEVEPPTNTE